MARAHARDIALTCALAAGVAVSCWVSVSESDGRSRASRFDERCRPSAARLVAANRYARIYYERSVSELAYCRPGRSEPEITLFAEQAYPPPAISLVGPYLGYAGNTSEPGSVENIVIVDTRRDEQVVFFKPANGGVGSLKVNSQGSVAWIACPAGSLAVGDLQCTESGTPETGRDPRSIYRHDSRSTEQDPIQLVARSRRIEVGSLRRKGGCIYWKQGGRTLHASLR